MNITEYYQVYYPVPYHEDEYMPDGVNYLHSVVGSGWMSRCVPIYGANAKDACNFPTLEAVIEATDRWLPTCQYFNVMHVGEVAPEDRTFLPWGMAFDTKWVERE